MSAKTMEINWNHYYGTMEKLSLLTGLWPFLKPGTRVFRVTFMTVMVLTLLIPEIAFQTTCKRDIQCSFRSLTAYMLTFAVVVKVLTFQLHIQRFKELTERLFIDWRTLETPEEYAIVRSHAETCRRFSIIYPVYCLLAVYVFMSVSIVPPILDVIFPLNESRPVLLPYPGYYFVDSEKYFYYIYGHSIVSWEIIMTGLVAHDCMFVSYVEHVCSMFAVVGYRFEYLFCSRNDSVNDMKSDLDDTYCKKIALFVHTHRKTLEFAQLLENTFTVPFAIQLMIIISTMSCTLLQITQESGTLDILRYVFYVIGQLLHLFCLSFEGQKLIDHSLQMRDKIYNSSWYEAPLKSRKMLIITMMQSARPISLSAGKIYIFSMESFTTVLQTSMSYFTVLASFQ